MHEVLWIDAVAGIDRKGWVGGGGISEASKQAQHRANAHIHTIAQPRTFTLIPNPLALDHTLSLTRVGNFLPFNL